MTQEEFEIYWYQKYIPDLVNAERVLQNAWDNPDSFGTVYFRLPILSDEAKQYINDNYEGYITIHLGIFSPYGTGHKYNSGHQRDDDGQIIHTEAFPNSLYRNNEAKRRHDYLLTNKYRLAFNEETRHGPMCYSNNWCIIHQSGKSGNGGECICLSVNDSSSFGIRIGISNFLSIYETSGDEQPMSLGTRMKNMLWRYLINHHASNQKLMEQNISDVFRFSICAVIHLGLNENLDKTLELPLAGPIHYIEVPSL